MKRIRALRKANELSQKELAKQLGVGQSTISGWENGKIKPLATNLQCLAKILGCTIDELFDDET